MLTKNVYFAERPDSVIIRTHDTKAIVEIPKGITKVETEDGTQYMAKELYSIETRNAPGLKERVEKNKNLWIEAAKKSEPAKASLEDVIEAINTLTDIVIGGM